KLIWQYPEAKVLLDSPAILMLRWIQKQFPVLKPAGVRDSFPLMTVPSASGDTLISQPQSTKTMPPIQDQTAG
ncbi:copper-binding protein, partial [Photobacterium sp. OFAV2-7]|nr:copper-binding protein [Photobacterium sp. OFAV2-7]